MKVKGSRDSSLGRQPDVDAVLIPDHRRSVGHLPAPRVLSDELRAVGRIGASRTIACAMRLRGPQIRWTWLTGSMVLDFSRFG